MDFRFSGTNAGDNESWRVIDTPISFQNEIIMYSIKDDRFPIV